MLKVAARLFDSKGPVAWLIQIFEAFVMTKVASDNTKSVAVALFYGVCSISMNFLNKAVVSSYEFNYPFFIMACQMVATVIFLDLLCLTGLLHLPAYTFRESRDFMPASFCFALHSTMSLSALHGMNIPMYGAIKRCTPLVSLILSVLLLKKKFPSILIVLSIMLITFGVFVASFGDLEFDRYAYTMGTLSVFAQGGYLTLVQKSSESSKRTTIEMLHINSINTLPFFVVVSILTKEPFLIAQSNSYSEPGFFPTYIILILSGCILTFSQFLCAAVCSALTTSLVGVAKSVLQTFIGFFTFGGVPINAVNIIGLSLNTIGGCTYSYVKYKEGVRRAESRDLMHRNRSELDIEKGLGDKNGVVKNSHVL